VEPGAETIEQSRNSERTPPRIGPLRWALWWVALFFALIIFYGLFAFFWFGLRLAAWIAEFRARRHRPKLAG
jgi:lauroyl/myristoyl acyltransferase